MSENNHSETGIMQAHDCIELLTEVNRRLRITMLSKKLSKLSVKQLNKSSTILPTLNRLKQWRNFTLKSLLVTKSLY